METEPRYIKVKRVYRKPHARNFNETENASLLLASNDVHEQGARTLDTMFSVVQVTGAKNETKEDKLGVWINHGGKISSKRKISSPCYTFIQSQEIAQNKSFQTNEYRVLTRNRSGSGSMVFPSMNSKRQHSNFSSEEQVNPIYLPSTRYDFETPGRCTPDQETTGDVKSRSRKVSFSNQSMLHSAVSRDDVAELSDLIDNNGIDLDLPDEVGMTMLHRAAVDGSHRCLSFLLSRGAHVDVTDHEGWTPLHDAVFHGQTRCAFCLLSAGADVEAETKNFLKPIEMAASEDMVLLVGRAMASNGTRQNPNYDKETLV